MVFFATWRSADRSRLGRGRRALVSTPFLIGRSGGMPQFERADARPAFRGGQGHGARAGAARITGPFRRVYSGEPRKRSGGLTTRPRSRVSSARRPSAVTPAGWVEPVSDPYWRFSGRVAGCRGERRGGPEDGGSCCDRDGRVDARGWPPPVRRSRCGAVAL